jgi:hypothetical protein
MNPIGEQTQQIDQQDNVLENLPKNGTPPESVTTVIKLLGAVTYDVKTVFITLHFLCNLQVGPISYMKNTYCLFQIKFIIEYPNVQQIIITQILLKQFN